MSYSNLYPRLNNFIFATFCIMLAVTVALGADSKMSVDSPEYFSKQAIAMADFRYISQTVEQTLQRYDKNIASIEHFANTAQNPAIIKRLEVFKALNDYVEKCFAKTDPGWQLLAWQGTEELKIMLDYFEMEKRRSATAVPAPKVVSLKDFGAKGDGKNNDTLALRKAFEFAKAQKQPVKLLIPVGTYLIEPEAEETQPDVSFTDYRLGEGSYRTIPYKNLRDSSHMLLVGSRYLTIEGEDNARLLFADSSRGGLRIIGADELTIRNIIVDYREPCYTQGTVVSLDKNTGTLDFKVDDGFPAPDIKRFTDAPSYRITPFYEDKNRFSGQTVRIKNCKRIGDGVYRIAPLFLKKDTSSWGVLKSGGRACIIARYDSRHNATGIDLRYCRFPTFDRITVYSSPGHGLRGITCYALTLTNYRRIPETPAHFVSTNGDGFQGGSTLIGPYIADSIFSRGEDDGININSRCVEIASIARDASAENPSSENADGVFVIDLMSGMIDAVSRVVNGHYQPALPANIRSKENMKQQELTYGEKLRRGVFGDASAKYNLRPHRLIPLNGGTCGTIISKCKFGNFRGLGIQATSPNMLIEDCSFEKLTSCGISVCALMSWNMGFSPHNVIIRRCNFEELDLGPGVWAMCRPLDRSKPIKARPIGDIRIEENTFVYQPGASMNLVSLSNCHDVVVEKNRFITGTPDVKTIFLDNFKSVKFINNEFSPNYTKGFSPVKYGKNVQLAER